METSESDVFTSVLLVNNIHCPSCVSYAEDVLGSIPEIVKVTISIVNHEIRLEHRHAEAVSAAITELTDAAFEVQHVTTAEGGGKVVGDREIVDGSYKGPNPFAWTLSMSRAQSRHIENCTACRTKMANQSKKGRLWSGIRTRDKSFDVEKQHSLETLVEQAPSNECSSQKLEDDEQRPKQESVAYTATLSIVGMTCASCSGSITKELKDLDLVKSVSINLMANNGSVTYWGPKQNINKVIEAIEDIGYEASVEDVKASSVEDSPRSSRKLTASLSIHGMTCGSCVGTITRSLQKIPCIHAVNIDLVGNSGKIEFVV